MTAQQPPRQNDANLAANDKSCSDSRSATSTCPLMSRKVQLLPLRYGLTEGVDPAAELPMPFALQSRALGIRLVRNGYLYIIDNSTGYLHEYRIEQAVVTKLLWQGAEVSADVRSNSIGEPHLIFPRRSTLHAAYSELQWTARKCAQVLGSREERDYFMQTIDLRCAEAQTGGAHLLARHQMESWLAEVVQNKVQRDAQGEQTFPAYQNQSAPPPETNPQERQPYLWEDPPLFRDIPLGELTEQILPEHEHDALFLLLRDDIGVMRDLAQFQDKVVGWIEAWADGGAQQGANERDYLLACYIESMTQIGASDLPSVIDTDAQAMLDDLGTLAQPAQGQTRQALLDYLNGEPLPRPMDPSTPEPLHRPVEHNFTRNKMAAADPGFVERNLNALIKAKKSQDGHIRDALNGAKFGQRGINDLIDRPAMDSFLATHRGNLDRWQSLLKRIAADRAQMLVKDRFHRAAWYYDLQQVEQVGLAFTTQYACLRDICSSDTENESILAWMEEKPEYARPLFHTLPSSEQTQLGAIYAMLAAAGYAIVSNMPVWRDKLAEAENTRLPVVDDLPGPTKAIAQSAQQTLSPALAQGISDTMAEFYKALGQQQVPELEGLFRTLPKVLRARLLDAARFEGVTFTVASDAEKVALQNDIREVLSERAELKALVKQREQVKASAGHKSPKAQALQVEIQRIRSLLDTLEPRLAAALSPIAELPDAGVRIAAAAPGRAGVTLVLPAAQQQEVAGLMHNLRNGYTKAPALNRLGDGVGVAVFVAQFVNLVQVAREFVAQPSSERNRTPLLSALFATGAAGFSAAQAISDTGLKARSAQLAQALQVNTLEAVQVRIGQLHIGLGFFGYGFGFVAAGFGLSGHHGEWLNAVRQGNGRAQQGATAAMLGSSGLMASNAYGLGHTAVAAVDVFRNITDIGLRRAAWAAAGTRLTTVFFRFNIAGAIFTAIEWGGSWWYNRNNTSRHDDWLLSTPWSADAEQRQSWTLQVYQEQLQQIAQAPSAEVVHGEHGSWWRDLLGGPTGIKINLKLPGLNEQALAMPLAGKPSALLALSAYRINNRQYDRGPIQVTWSPISEAVVERLQLADTAPLQLRVPPPSAQQGSIAGMDSAELLLGVRLELLDPATGQYQPQQHMIRLSPNNSGHYPSAEHAPQGAAATWVSIDPLLLPETTDADK